jgi:CRP-like cAMP-binding protein
MVEIRTTNKLLSALDRYTFQRLLPYLEPVTLKRKQVLYEPGDHIRNVYFPETAVIVLVTIMANGETIESATVGREGVTWISAIFGAPTMPCQTVVAIEGDALKMEVERLEPEVGQNQQLRDLLGHYSHALLIHSMRSTACNGLHTLDQRCARWLLTTLDRVEPNDRLSITHDFVAYLLGASRQTITTLMNDFAQKDYIDIDRGSITVHRARLERAACECYAIIKEQFAKIGTGK